MRARRQADLRSTSEAIATQMRPVIVAWLAVFLTLCLDSGIAAETSQYRILHVASYHLDWQWSAEQFEGFQDALQGLDVQYRLVEMDTNRRNDTSWRRERTKEAQVLIEEWQPDLVYTTDDHAQEYLTRHYVGSATPFVFSGVNADLESYGLDSANNVTGILERQHTTETLKLLRRLAPDVRRIAVIVDRDPTWPGVVRELRQALVQAPDITVVEWKLIETFEEYRKTLSAYQGSVDAVGTLGIFQFKDAAGRNVPYEQVLRWTVDNIDIPDFSFWLARVEQGTLCAVTVSGFAQGHAAGALARRILTEGLSPGDLPVQSTRRGRPAINLARARKLGLALSSSDLLAAEIINRFAWQE